MSDPFVAEIRILGCNFAPVGWAFCDGQLIPISQNTALFSLLGTTYGGNGTSNFALPDLQGRVPMHPGQSTTGTLYDLGQQAGSETVTLLQTEIPAHTHVAYGSSGDDDSTMPAGHLPGALSVAYAPTAGATTVAMASQALTTTGSGLPHNNMQPYLTLNFCIAIQGIFPARW